MERRRCNHHELEEPLAPLDCISSVIDPKGSGTNKNRYVIASQEEKVRRFCRGLKGVPLIYVKRSVMVMEPMSEGSIGVRENTEKEKFRQGLRGRVAGLGKRKRSDEDREDVPDIDGAERGAIVDGEERNMKKQRTRGLKGPNPLSVKKSKGDTKMKTANVDADTRTATIPQSSVTIEGEVKVNIVGSGEMDDSHPSRRKKKRRRQKHKSRDSLPSANNEEEQTLSIVDDGARGTFPSTANGEPVTLPSAEDGKSGDET